jgi:hypothetical protein
LGSEFTVGDWWSGPAAILELPLIFSIYEYGFNHGIRWSGSQLRSLLSELSRLETYWASSNLPANLADRLAERAQFLRSAVAVAEKRSGWIVIT